MYTIEKFRGILTQGKIGKEIGIRNRYRVREFMAAHIGATNIECGKALNLSPLIVGKHIKAIRAEWLPTHHTTGE